MGRRGEYFDIVVYMDMVCMIRDYWFYCRSFCIELLGAVRARLEWILPQHLEGHHHRVHFQVISALEEAQFENHAVMVALKYGRILDLEHSAALKDAVRSTTKTPRKSQISDLIGNLAWGNGSTQGILGPGRTVTIPFGLEFVETSLKKNLDHVFGAHWFRDVVSDQLPTSFSAHDRNMIRTVIDRVQHGVAKELLDFGFPTTTTVLYMRA